MDTLYRIWAAAVDGLPVYKQAADFEVHSTFVHLGGGGEAWISVKDENTVAVGFSDVANKREYAWFAAGSGVEDETVITTTGSDVIQKIEDFRKTETYDDSVEIELEMTDAEIQLLTFLASEAGLSVDDYIVEILTNVAKSGQITE